MRYRRPLLQEATRIEVAEVANQLTQEGLVFEARVGDPALQRDDPRDFELAGLVDTALSLCMHRPGRVVQV